MKKGEIIPFNPLDKRHLGESVAQAILRQPVVHMADLARFAGAGIYAIYYQGDFVAYEQIAKANRKRGFVAPIYVGKASPKGSRKGGTLEGSPGYDLYGRLREHRNSIEQAINLEISDFYCRYMVVDDIWIPLGETLLIVKFNPIWNKIIDGFGNHEPGSGRRAGMLSRWDVLHPGRSWADKYQPRQETSDMIITEAREYLRNNPPLVDPTII